jgi:histidyl-tRNA synthetase
VVFFRLVVSVAAKALTELGFSSYRILLNDRNIFGDLPLRAIATIDKRKKIGDDGVKKELEERGFDPEILDQIKQSHPTQTLHQIIKTLPEFGVHHDTIHFEPTLARGLDYYTSTIVEIEIDDYPVGSVCGGGRYDRLIEQFTGQVVPSVGFAFGFDRLIEAMETLNLTTSDKTKTRVLVTVFDPKYQDESLYLTHKLRNAGIATDMMLSSEAKLEKQLKYADKKGIPYVIIFGPDEINRGVFQLKNLKTKTQEALSLESIITILAHHGQS